MINLGTSINDDTLQVSLVARTDQATVSFYIKLGSDYEQPLAINVPATGGVAVYIDSSPPQKTPVGYFAVANNGERSDLQRLVVPSTFSLVSPGLQGDIRLGDLVLNTIDSDGTVWAVTDIDGYWRLPDAQVPTVDRSILEDGSYDDVGRFTDRTMTLTGMFLPRSEDTLITARQKLTAAFSNVRSTTMLEVDEMPPRRLTVRSNGKSDIQTIRLNGLTQFSVQLLAADPLKYSVSPMVQPDGQTAFSVITGASSGGRGYPRAYTVAIDANPLDDVRQYGSLGSPNLAQIVNLGNYPTAPVWTIPGPVLNPVIQNADTGEYVAFTVNLSSGQYLTVDVKDKTVLLNGATSLRGTMTFSSTWFTLPPGTTTLRYTSSSGGSTNPATVEAYSAWL